MGYLKIGGQNMANPCFLLCNTTGLEVQVNPIMSTAVFGSGWSNAAQVTNFADNQLTYEGPVEFDLQGNTTVWNHCKEWGITNRAYPKSVELSPDGSQVYSYTYANIANWDGVWCQSMSLRFAPDALSKASVTGVAIKRTSTFADLQYFDNTNGVGTPQSPVNPSPRNLNPIPGWNTTAQFLNKTTSLAGNPILSWDPTYDDTEYPIEVVDYNFDITNNTKIIRTCNGKRVPAAVLQGAQNVTGSATLYREGGVIDPVLMTDDGLNYSSSYWFADDTMFQVDIGGVFTVKVPYVLVTASTGGVRGQNETSTRTINFQGVGNGVVAPILFT